MKKSHMLGGMFLGVCYTIKNKEKKNKGHLGDSVVECLPLAQVMILGS